MTLYLLSYQKSSVSLTSYCHVGILVDFPNCYSSVDAFCCWCMFNSLKFSCSEFSQIVEEFEEVPVQSRGFGILDVGYRSKVFELNKPIFSVITY